MTPERYQRITQVLSRRQPDLTVITDEVHKGRNLAAIIRNCDAIGIDRIHCVVPQKGYQTFGGTSASAEKWVEVAHHMSVNEPIASLKLQGFQIVAANVTPDTVDYREVDYTRPTAILMGAEVDGVSETASELVDQHVMLPMFGMVESYNVSVACALILNEVQRQREKAGLYDTLRLPEDLYQKRYMHWAHPVIAKLCDEKGIPYPPIREDGEIENLSTWYAGIK
ncbi:tRNA (guanosine(18)-2'-O)-methyltransferase TrmH [Teredinibacter sp. KSP-S5-2]|uniref:tRNA (guanosine(18)-2'-O)-methyltransferase TrmH n=1 Tax=Teredinibacter sp. KSP-S5-2 TaxID=3034506 RepID=UPI0029341C99|nr:tRNA (guanosine(18)-2'-O)-methyltransferase TrmH [Teredinibacter sp. KSP-S5-2]WNO11392.1 tRNA (guanosine(18)-2'-O)-methyltransferase TrmH [Teredinibacter sp. KSP-S5-2]